MNEKIKSHQETRSQKEPQRRWITDLVEDSERVKFVQRIKLREERPLALKLNTKQDKIAVYYEQNFVEVYCLSLKWYTN